MESASSQTELSKFEESLQKQLNKQFDELVVLRLKLTDLVDENARLRIERRMLQEALAQRVSLDGR